jgi:A/G-specific adenine glycosylase
MNTRWEETHKQKLARFRAERKGSAEQIKAFRAVVRHHYRLGRRSFVWREQPTPYYVFVSEIMLQQTQTSRVEEKFPSFVERFPSFEALARARLRTVLRNWQGLGYNRRARALHQSAKIIIREYEGELPNSPDVLQLLPGVGPYTAGAVCAFAFDQATVFLETNIRSVFLELFFARRSKVHDRSLLPFVEQSLDRRNPRDWYYALMDYGAYLKRLGIRNNTRSAHYTRQSPFDGSDRQYRGRLLRELSVCSKITDRQAQLLLGGDPARCERIISALCKEGLLTRRSRSISIS